MKNILILGIGLTLGYIGGSGILDYRPLGETDSHPAIIQIKDVPCLPEKIDQCMSYNAGYRSGRLEAFSEVVDLYGVQNRRVVISYNSMVSTMKRLGELE